MNGIKIKKDDKYFLLSLVHLIPVIDGKYRPYEAFFLTKDDGEGMELSKTNEAKLYDAIDKFFQEHM